MGICCDINLWSHDCRCWHFWGFGPANPLSLHVQEQPALTLLHSDRTKKTWPYSVWKTPWALHSREGGGPAPPAISNKGCYELQREWSPLQQHPASDQDLSIQTGAAGWHGCRQIQPGAAVCQRAVWWVPGNNHRRWEAPPFLVNVWMR